MAHTEDEINRMKTDLEILKTRYHQQRKMDELADFKAKQEHEDNSKRFTNYGTMREQELEKAAWARKLRELAGDETTKAGPLDEFLGNTL